MERSALICGADTNSIGLALAQSLLKKGYAVTIADEGKFKEGSKSREGILAETRGSNSPDFEQVDFSSNTSIEEFVSRLSAKEYDVVIHCSAALAATQQGGLRNEGVDFDVDQFNSVLQRNVTSIAAVSLGLRDQLRSGASIVVITSSAAFEGAFATISYNASKAAAHNLVKSLANILGPTRGVRVNAVAPGWIPPSDDAAATGVVALADALTPTNARGSAANVVAAVHYLVENSFHNGDIVAIDGGIESSYLPYLMEYLQLQGLLSNAELDQVIHLVQAAKVKVR
jgi:NAD(P)-dependent dehydrogenase (short-subunit alcohol dehydrogenase family)